MADTTMCSNNRRGSPRWYGMGSKLFEKVMKNKLFIPWIDVFYMQMTSKEM